MPDFDSSSQPGDDYYSQMGSSVAGMSTGAPRAAAARGGPPARGSGWRREDQSDTASIQSQDDMRSINMSVGGL